MVREYSENRINGADGTQLGSRPIVHMDPEHGEECSWETGTKMWPRSVTREAATKEKSFGMWWTPSVRDQGEDG